MFKKSCEISLEKELKILNLKTQNILEKLYISSLK